MLAGGVRVYCLGGLYVVSTVVLLDPLCVVYHTVVVSQDRGIP